MLFAIGAGGRIFLGSAADPMGAWNGGTAADADLDDVTGNLAASNLTTDMGTVDVTKLDADLQAYFRQFIAGLRGATVNGTFGDDTTGAFIRRLDAIATGTNHVPTGGSTTSQGGRGKVDFKVHPFGTATGRLVYYGTLIVTQAVLNSAVETEIGGTWTATIDGELALGVQS